MGHEGISIAEKYIYTRVGAKGRGGWDGMRVMD